MAITATERTQIIQLVVGLYDAAPGATFLNDFAAYIDGGASMLDLANGLTNDPLFNSPAYFPSYLTNAEFAAKFRAEVERWARVVRSAGIKAD